ncbi:MAG: FAD-dependent oxidoreductase [Polyangiales bacterium]
MSLRTARVARTRALTHNVRELTLDPGEGFSFVAGQWVSLRIPVENQEFVTRSYSIASPPRADGQFEIAVTRVEGGPGSTALHTLADGASLEISHAQGFFTLDPVLRPALMIATGTGLAPLRSMLLSALSDRECDERFTLLLGVRSDRDLLYRDELEALERAHPARFRFVPTLSRADESWSGRRGYVQTHCRELVNELGGDVDAYVCGLQRMVKEVRAVLKGELGFSRERIHSERFD